MVFLQKRPSVVPRVLSDADCPPHDIFHTPCQYPRYYDSLYYPQYHLSDFQDSNSVCQWLLSGLEQHRTTCSRRPCSDLGHTAVHYREGLFTIAAGNSSLSLTVADIESAVFSFCRLARQFVNLTAYTAWLPAAEFVLGQNPSWLNHSEELYVRTLDALPRSELYAAAHAVHPSESHSNHRKADYVRVLLLDFLHERLAFLDADLSSVCPRATTIAKHFTRRYGASIAGALRVLHPAIQADCASSDVRHLIFGNHHWLCISFQDMHQRMQRLPKQTILRSLKGIPSYVRPPYSSRSVRASSSALVMHILGRVRYLCSLNPVEFFQAFFSVLPFDEQYRAPRDVLTKKLLDAEYGNDIILHLSAPLLSRSAKAKKQRRDKKLQRVKEAAASDGQISEMWPTVVAPDVVFECLERYRCGTIWERPLVCCVCGLERKDTIDVEVPAVGDPPLDFFPLHISDPFITSRTNFQYGLDTIDGAMLDRQGFKSHSADGVVMQICAECHSGLTKKKVPRLSLANHLYRGSLPEEFKDLTWIEEMVCAKYRNTAHITRIYQSSDPSQPKVFHGNTCAHDMNVVSTASVLPRTPADINGMLSVVFIGPGKFKPDNLGALFKIRKAKVWGFLLWLKEHNRLYTDMTLDPDVINLYPDDDILPGIEHCIIEDHNTQADVRSIFAEETAGFSEHPAEVLGSKGDSDGPLVLLEKMGVSDPEGIKLSGRTFTASALKNLVSFPSQAPDLILHRSSAAVPEYNNPDLMPGMFPTLFPLGLGGFDNPNRPTKLSFQAQANALLDVPDKLFRHHQSYIFVALNIIQRRWAHLHTHFTVRKSKFDSIAKDLIKVPPDVLQSLADHLQQEKKLGTLTSAERHAMDLLKQVNTISARIPGSQASKIFTRNEIRSYFSEFGLPHIYFTMNPSVTHNPIFQVMVGDQTVDLSNRFPFLVPSHERALRLALDPVAAADFFEFCVSTVFEYLFGWDYAARKSSQRGGILGHLRAFYGTCEFTERGSLHGHFLIWLVGASNPNEIHRRLREEPGFERRFFDFFEDVIQHHLPDVEISLDKQYEPRIERPPVPPQSATGQGISAQSLHEWHLFMESEVKKLGEILQRHICKPVCHKYGNEDKCRFQFPHEIVPESYFESDTNSVVLKCLDSMVNYFNRYILVYCRHNHDIKCILSGKAAKAAMYYITDYITKMDVKTYEMLSLLSRAVASMPSDHELPPRQHARLLLHRCLAQFSRQQQIHAQQAARYLRGKKDSISSHESTPMMTGLLLDFLQTQYQMGPKDETDDPTIEQTHLKIQTDHNGNLVNKNQVMDYWYRADSLSQMNFYEFARCITLENKNDRVNISNFDDARLGTLERHSLHADHPLAETHHLVQHTNEERGDCNTPLIPRVIGSIIPRQNTGQWKFFALAHFKPFGPSNPLVTTGSCINDTYNNFTFSSRSKYVMKNWEDAHECEDQQDAERLRKRAALTTESLAMTKAINKTLSDLDVDDIDVLPGEKKSAEKDFSILQQVRLLEQSLWLGPNTAQHIPEPTPTAKNEVQDLPTPTAHLLKSWMQDIKEQEQSIAHNRRNAQDFPTLTPVANITGTEQGITAQMCNSPMDYDCPPTDVSHKIGSDLLSAEDVIEKIGKECGLNEKQWVAYRIIARSFISRHVYKQDVKEEPLRMFMTGPGGTGKTHVVKAVQKVMEHYGVAHSIRFLAPTGSAATLIDGMTIHKGLGIKVKSNEKGKGNRKLGEHSEDYSVIISVQNRTQLRDEYRLVEIVMLDECSLLSVELISEVDAALRYAKEKPNEWFGGVMVIFAGDLYQYPPVGGTPLYNPIPAYSSQSNKEIAKRLGRLAWKSVNAVVSLTEQERMKEDPAYGSAICRLRTRECTLEDVELFNSRVIKSAINETGIDMSLPENLEAAAIVRTNLLRETLNIRKAHSNCDKTAASLVLCAAFDKCSTRDLNRHDREWLLNLNMTSVKFQNVLPGFVPLYVGMPIVLKTKNISTDLGITNGSQGIVRSIQTEICPVGLTYCTCVLAEFPDSKVTLPGLPKGYFPIVPVKSTFTTLLTDQDGTTSTIQVTRNQVPVQPGFAVTGQSAQGKTLPKVLAPLHAGGFGAYVAASRARNRKGLCITEPVTLQDLNKPLPFNLCVEANRLDALEHNTYIRYGFREGTPRSVQDPESEMHIKNTSFVTSFEVPVSTRKRKFTGAEESVNVTKNRKRPRTTQSLKSPSGGCTWSETDWSCAYDSVLMTVFYAYLSFSDHFRQRWSQQTDLNRALDQSFRHLMSCREMLMSCHEFNTIRDHLRDFLSSRDPQHFPRHGRFGAPADLIFDYLKQADNNDLTVIYTCESSPACGPPVIIPTEEKLPTIWSTQTWNEWRRRSEWLNLEDNLTRTSIQTLLDVALAARTEMPQNIPCDSSCTSQRVSRVYVSNPPPLLVIEVSPGMVPTPVPCAVLKVPGTQKEANYALRAVIYLGNFHFTAKLIDNNGQIWAYDGKKNGGIPCKDSNCVSTNGNSELDLLMDSNGQSAHLYIYAATL